MAKRGNEAQPDASADALAEEQIGEKTPEQIADEKILKEISELPLNTEKPEANEKEATLEDMMAREVDGPMFANEVVKEAFADFGAEDFDGVKIGKAISEMEGYTKKLEAYNYKKFGGAGHKTLNQKIEGMNDMKKQMLEEYRRRADRE